MMLRIIAGDYRSRRIAGPDNNKTRPTTDRSRETLFQVIENLIDLDGKRILDLFAGTGAVALEALSRGAGGATLIEKDRHAVASIKENIEMLDVTQTVKVISRDVFAALPDLKDSFDIIFVDPPYADKRQLKELPELLLQMSVLNENGLIILEHSSHDKVKEIEGAEIIKQLKVGEASFTLLIRKGDELVPPDPDKPSRDADDKDEA